ncbi:MAG TPA: OmpH family outer membrane protein, partial [Syntrophaceae bacterium]|nr:OmpH family outer membrane protein [Syntrophaceae bacterium]
DYRDAFTDFQEELAEAQREAVMPIQQDIVNLVRKIAKEEGFTLIYDPQIMGPAIYAPNAIDLTDRVIKIYNKQKTMKKTSGP